MFVGTGDRYHPNNTSSNRFYGIKENTSMTNGSVLTESNLTNLSSGAGTVTQGWYVPMASNEKVLASSDVFSSTVFFTTFTPTTVAVCGGGGGDAKLYSINMTTGDGALNLTTGAVAAAGTAAITLAKTIGTGIPSKPIIIMNQSGNQATPYVISGTTNQQISTTQIPLVALRKLIGLARGVLMRFLGIVFLSLVIATGAASAQSVDSRNPTAGAGIGAFSSGQSSRSHS